MTDFETGFRAGFLAARQNEEIMLSDALVRALRALHLEPAARRVLRRGSRLVEVSAEPVREMR